MIVGLLVVLFVVLGGGLMGVLGIGLERVQIELRTKANQGIMLSLKNGLCEQAPGWGVISFQPGEDRSHWSLWCG